MVFGRQSCGEGTRFDTFYCVCNFMSRVDPIRCSSAPAHLDIAPQPSYAVALSELPTGASTVTLA